MYDIQWGTWFGSVTMFIMSIVLAILACKQNKINKRSVDADVGLVYFKHYGKLMQACMTFLMNTRKNFSKSGVPEEVIKLLLADFKAINYIYLESKLLSGELSDYCEKNIIEKAKELYDLYCRLFVARGQNDKTAENEILNKVIINDKEFQSLLDNLHTHYKRYICISK